MERQGGGPWGATRRLPALGKPVGHRKPGGLGSDRRPHPPAASPRPMRASSAVSRRRGNPARRPPHSALGLGRPLAAASERSGAPQAPPRRFHWFPSQSPAGWASDESLGRGAGASGSWCCLCSVRSAHLPRPRVRTTVGGRGGRQGRHGGPAALHRWPVLLSSGWGVRRAADAGGDGLRQR